MAAKLILNNAKSPLGYLLRSSALSSVRIAAGRKPLAGADSLRRGIFDSEAQKLAGVRLWGLNSDPFDLKLAAAREGGPKKTVDASEESSEDSESEETDEEYNSNDDSDYTDNGMTDDGWDYESPSEGDGDTE